MQMGNCLRLVETTRLLLIRGKIKPTSLQRNFWNMLLNSSAPGKHPVADELRNPETMHCSNSQLSPAQGKRFRPYALQNMLTRERNTKKIKKSKYAFQGLK